MFLPIIFRFQIDVASEASLVYNGKGVIENFSLANALALARDLGLFSDMAKDSVHQVCKDIVEIVLASDMSRHFQIVSNFKTTMIATANSETESSNSTSGSCHRAVKATGRVIHDIHMEERETKMTILKVAFKVADLGHCYLPWAQHLEWVERLEEEFFLQGDAERAEKLSVSALMDRSMPGACDNGNCAGFFKVFVIPLLEPWVAWYPSCLPLMQQARSNMEQHESVRHQSNPDASLQETKQVRFRSYLC